MSASAGESDNIREKAKSIKGVKEALVVTGRADVAVFVEGSLEEIKRAVASVFTVDGVVATESLLEMA